MKVDKRREGSFWLSTFLPVPHRKQIIQSHKTTIINGEAGEEILRGSTGMCKSRLSSD